MRRSRSRLPSAPVRVGHARKRLRCRGSAIAGDGWFSRKRQRFARPEGVLQWVVLVRFGSAAGKGTAQRYAGSIRPTRAPNDDEAHSATGACPPRNRHVGFRSRGCKVGGVSMARRWVPTFLAPHPFWRGGDRPHPFWRGGDHADGRARSAPIRQGRGVRSARQTQRGQASVCRAMKKKDLTRSSRSIRRAMKKRGDKKSAPVSRGASDPLRFTSPGRTRSVLRRG